MSDFTLQMPSKLGNPVCHFDWSLPSQDMSKDPFGEARTIFIWCFSGYLIICLLSTIYDLVDRYRRDLSRLKVSKLQKQLIHEEQQRKLMRNLMSDTFYDDIMEKATSEALSEIEEADDEEDEIRVEKYPRG